MKKIITPKKPSYKLILLLVLLGWNVSIFGQHPEWKSRNKLSPSVLDALAKTGLSDVVLEFEPLDMQTYTRNIADKETKGSMVYHTLKAHADKTQSSVRKQLDLWNVKYKSYWVVNIIAAKLSAGQIKSLSQSPDIYRILSDAPVSFTRPVPVKTDRITYREAPEISWGIRRILADSVWARDIKGKGVVVAGQDTGYKWDVDGIKSKYRGFRNTGVNHNYNWHDAIIDYSPLNADSSNPCGLNIKIPCDDHGHGTHTMGTMVGENDTLKYGVAPEAKWIGCRCMERGWGKPSSYIDCFEWFIAPTDLEGQHPDPGKAPAVINNSWGCPQNEGCNPDNYDIMRQVVDNVKAAGIVVVVSAGNDGSQGCSSIRNPAAIYESSFSVGALHPNDTIARFSSRGPVLSDGSHRTKPDITAPGVAVISQLPDGSLRSWNGTSMAGPHVAGVVALMISANPNLAGQVDVIEEMITSTARRRFFPADSCDADPSSIPNNVYGYGIINALEAVKKALAWHPVRTENPLPVSGISVAPNPTKALISFRFKEDKDASQRRIIFTNLNGQTLDIKPFYKDEKYLRYDFSSFPKGIYLYRIQMKEGVALGKFVKD